MVYFIGFNRKQRSERSQRTKRGSFDRTGPARERLGPPDPERLATTSDWTLKKAGNSPPAKLGASSWALRPPGFGNRVFIVPVKEIPIQAMRSACE